jgi:hypothetical protein
MQRLSWSLIILICLEFQTKGPLLQLGKILDLSYPYLLMVHSSFHLAITDHTGDKNIQ